MGIMKRPAKSGSTTRAAVPNASGATALVLEPRFLFDAAGVETAVQTALHDTAMPDAEPQPADTQLLEALASAPAPAAGTQAADTTTARRELVVVDAAVADQGTLLADLRPGTETLILQTGRDALEQIAEALGRNPGFDAVHILSHGSPGELVLGDTALNSDTLAEHGTALDSIRASLAPGADILLYGCDVGAGAEGTAFLDRLAGATGADVSASDDATGSAGRGGDWVLESASGGVETQVFASARTQADFRGLLAYTLSGSTGWVPLMGSGTNDPVGDSQAKAADTDLVGDANHAVLYGAYDDNGSPTNPNDDLMAFRVRIDNPTSSTYFGGVAVVGIDANRDGRVDVFMGVDGRNNTQAIRLFDPGTGLNNSPSTTTTSPVPVGWLPNNGVYAFTASNYSVRAVSDATDPQWDGTTDFGRDGKTDVFVSFRVPVADLATVLAKPSSADRSGVLGPRGATGIAGFNRDTVVSYVLMTETQPGPLNGDLAGVGTGYNKDLTFAQLGAFTAPMTPSAPVAAGLTIMLEPVMPDGNLSSTDDNAVTVRGTVSASVAINSWIKVTISDPANGSVTRFVQVDGNRTWSVTDDLSALGEGTLTVTAELWSGNAGNDTRVANSLPATTTVLHDKTPPVVTATSVDTTANSGRPVLSGTADLPVGTRIAVTADPDNNAGTTNLVYWTTVAAGGLWRVDTATATPVSGSMPSTGLTSHTRVTASGTDAAGNVGTGIAQTVPTVNTLRTTQTQPVISGTWTEVPGDVLSVEVGDTTYAKAAGTLTVTATGWSLTPASALAVGTHEVTVRVTRDGVVVQDASHNEVTIDPVIVGVPPTIGINGDPTATLKDPRPTIAGTSQNAGGTVMVVLNPGDEGLGDAITYKVTTDGSGNWSLNTATAVPISGSVPSTGLTGTVRVIATATNSDGAQTRTQTLTIDPPALTIDAIATNATADSPAAVLRSDTTLNLLEATNVKLGGTSDAPAGSKITVTVTDSSGTQRTYHTTVSGGRWAVTLTDANGNATPLNLSGLAQGTLTVKAAIDGTSVERTATVQHDKTAAQLFILSPTTQKKSDALFSGVYVDTDTGAAVNSKSLLLSFYNWTNGAKGTAVSGMTGLAVTTGAGGTWTYTPPNGNSLPTGDVLVEITPATSATGTASVVTDAAGNKTATATQVVNLSAAGKGAGGTIAVSGITGTDGTSDTVIGTADIQGNVVISGTTSLSGSAISVAVTDSNKQALPALTTTAASTPTTTGGTQYAWSVTLTKAQAQQLANGQLTVVASASNSQTEVSNVAIRQLELTPPPLTISDDVPNVATGPITYSFTFGQAVTGFDINDITTSHGTLSNFVALPGGKVYTVDVTPPADSAGTLTLSVAADAATSSESGRKSIAASATQLFDRTGNAALPQVTVDVSGLATSAKPVISGTTTLQAGASVTVTVDPNNDGVLTDKLVYTAIVKAGGGWSIDTATATPTEGTLPSDGLSPYSHVEAKATNGYGDSATAIGQNTPTVAKQTVTVRQPAVTGTWANITNDVLTVTLNGAIYSQANQNLSVSGNSWSLTPAAPLADGTYQVQATVTRGGATVGDVTVSELVVDTTAAVGITSPALTTDTTPVISGTTDLPDGTLLTITIDPDNDPATGNSIVYQALAANGGWSIETGTTLPSTGSFPVGGLSGLVTVTAEGRDAAGNLATATQTLHVDLSPPAIAFTSNRKTPDSTPVITGTTDLPVGATITVQIDADNNENYGNDAPAHTYTTTVQAGGFWSVQTTTALSGTVGVKASGTDSAGNPASVTQPLTIDGAAPTIALTGNYGDANNDHFVSKTENGAVVIRGGTTSLAAGAKLDISITDGRSTIVDTATVQGDGTWSVANVNVKAFRDGVISVTASHTDSAGNVFGTSGSFVHDQTPPVATLTAATTAITGPVTVTATFNEPVVNLEDADFATSNNATVTGLASADGGKTWTFTLTPAVTGTTAVWLKDGVAQDRAGNPNTLSDPLSFNATLATPDNVLPTLISILRPSAAAELTNADTATFRVAFSEPVNGLDGSDFAVTVGGAAATATITVNAVTGVPGAYDVVVSGTDVASGNGELALSLKSADHGITDQAATPNALTNSTPSTTAQTYTLDNLAPTLVGTPAVNGSVIVLRYHEALAAVAPAVGDYTIGTDGAALSITGVSLNPTDNTVTLTLNRAVTGTEQVTLAYSATNKVQDKAGNAAAPFTATAITNNSPVIDTIAPVIDFAPTDGTTLGRTVASAGGSAVSLDDNTNQATLTEAGGKIAEIRVAVTGLSDGASETLVFGGTDVAADGSGGAVNNVTVAGVLVNVVHANGTFTIQKADWTNLTTAEAEAVIRAVQYRNDAGTVTAGNRGFAFTATDGSGNATAAAATVTVAVTAPAAATPPELDLNVEADGRNSTATFIEAGTGIDGTGPVAFAEAAAVTLPAARTVSQITLRVSGVTNGASESLTIGDATIPLSGAGTHTANAFGGALAVAVTESGGVLTVAVTRSGGGTFQGDEAGLLLQGMTYAHGAESPTAGDRSIQVIVTDDQNAASTAATATITVQPTNDGPSAADGPISVAEGGSRALAVADFGFTDPDGDTLSAVRITSLPGAGTLALNGVAVTEGQEVAAADIAAGKLVFTPDAGGNGTPYTSFDFRVSDGTAFTDEPNTIRVNVSANPAPVVDLNGIENGTGRTATFTEAGVGENGSGPILIAPAATLTDNATELNGLAFSVTGVKDGSAEKLVIGGTSVTLAAGTTATVTSDGVSYAVAVTAPADGVLRVALTPSGAGTLPLGKAQTLLQGIAYDHGSQAPTAGARAIAVTATDALGATSAGATATVTVVPTNDAPTLGTITADAVDQTGARATSYSFTVRYDDADGTIIEGTVTTGDVTVTGPDNQTLAVTGASWNAGAKTATYTVTPRGGSWDDGDAGTYRISINGSEVTDNGNAAVAAAPNAKSFTVAMDTTAPSAPALTLPQESDTGASHTDRLTALPTPTVRVALAGTGAVVGDRVSVRLGGTTEVGSVTLTADDFGRGHANVTLADLGADGAKSLTATITDAAGNTGAASTALEVVLDKTAPGIQSAVVNGQTLTLTYADAGPLDAVASAGPGAFAVTVGGQPVAVTAAVVDPTAKTVTLTLAAIAGHGQDVRVSYTDPTAGNDDHAVQDRAGNDAASVTSRSVTNDTPAPPAADPPPATPPVVPPVVTPPVPPVTPPVPPAEPPVPPTVTPPATPPTVPPVPPPADPAPVPPAVTPPPPPVTPPAPAPVTPPAPPPAPPAAPAPAILTIVQGTPSGPAAGTSVPVPPTAIMSTVSVLAPPPAVPTVTAPPPVVAPAPAAPAATPAAPTGGLTPAGAPSGGNQPSSGAPRTGADAFTGGSSRANNLPPPVALAPQGSTSGPSLQVVGTVGDRALSIGQPNNIPIPPGTFQSTDPQANVTLEATQADGSPLPVWLKFDASSGTFTGNPPPDAQGSVNIKVIARDDQGAQAVTEFRVNVGQNAGADTGAPQAPQRPQSGPAAPEPVAQPPTIQPDGQAPDSQAPEANPGRRADAEPAPPAGKLAFSRQVGAANGNSLAAEAAALLLSLETMLFG